VRPSRDERPYTHRGATASLTPTPIRLLHRVLQREAILRKISKKSAISCAEATHPPLISRSERTAKKRA
jgi:hypothetical protein